MKIGLEASIIYVKTPLRDGMRIIATETKASINIGSQQNENSPTVSVSFFTSSSP
jgi:hypothetical protein